MDVGVELSSSPRMTLFTLHSSSSELSIFFVCVVRDGLRRQMTSAACLSFKSVIKFQLSRSARALHFWASMLCVDDRWGEMVSANITTIEDHIEFF
jgi:hypothetical protein